MFKKIIFFIIGLLSFIDWFPYIEPSILLIVSNLSISLFVIFLVLNIDLSKFSTLTFWLISISFYVLFRVLFSSSQFGISSFYGFIVALVLLQRNFNLKYIINGFLLGGALNIGYMFLVFFDVFTADAYWLGNYRAQLGEWFVDTHLITIGLTNKYNKLSYLLAIFLFFILKKNFKFFTSKYLIIVLVLACQLFSGGRAGIYCSLILLFFYFFSRFNLTSLALSVGFIIAFTFYFDPILFFLDGYRVVDLLNTSSESRIFQFNYVLNNFQNYPIFGKGYEYIISIETPFIYIHNYILNHLIMGGLVGFILSLLFIYNLFKLTLKKLVGLDRLFFLVLFSFQLLVENFNLVSVLGSYIIIWVYISSKIDFNEHRINNSQL